MVRRTCSNYEGSGGDSKYLVQILVRLDAAASLPAPAATLHVHESTITITPLLTLSRLEMATGARPVANLTSLQLLRFSNGTAENSRGKRGNEDDETALHGGWWAYVAI